LNVPGGVLNRVERPGEEGQIRAVVEGAFRHNPVVATLVDRLRDSPESRGGHRWIRRDPHLPGV
jgi:hypothetical protein